MRFSTSFLAFALVWLSLASTVHGQRPTTSEANPAREAFEEGREHFDDQRYLLAAESFQRAYDLMLEAGMPNAWLILFNLGTSLDEIRGRERDARAAYAGYLEGAPVTDEESAQRVALVQSRIRELDLRIAAASSEPRDSSEEAGADTTPPSAPETTLSPIGPVVLASGGALLVAGAVVAAVLAVENDAFFAMCDAGVCPSSSRASAESVRDLAIATDVLLIGGAVVAATGLVLTLLLRDEVDEAPPVAAACGPDGCSIHLRAEL